MSPHKAGAAAPVSLYIYYRVRAEAANAASIAAARKVLAPLLPPHCGRFLLLRRADDPGTWMEVLEEVIDADAALDALGNAWRTSPLAAFVDPQTPRHVERFAP